MSEKLLTIGAIAAMMVLRICKGWQTERVGG